MKSKKIDKDNVGESKYPCLMVGNNEAVVLMTSDGIGTRLYGLSHRELGCHDRTWNMSVFKPYAGTIELSNE